MYPIVERHRTYFGYNLQLTNWILDLGKTCHMKSYILYFIPGSLVETDRYIKVVYRHFATEKNMISSNKNE